MKTILSLHLTRAVAELVDVPVSLVAFFAHLAHALGVLLAVSTNWVRARIAHRLAKFAVVRTASVVTLGLALLIAASGHAATVVGAAPTDVLDAIRSVENPTGSIHPGPCGELGPYQFTRSVWRQHSRLPFRCALDPVLSRQVAIKHLAWLAASLERHGLEPTPHRVALAWNAGIGAAITGRAPRASRDYAERVQNLVLSAQR